MGRKEVKQEVAGKSFIGFVQNTKNSLLFSISEKAQQKNRMCQKSYEITKKLLKYENYNFPNGNEHKVRRKFAKIIPVIYAFKN